MRALWFTNVPLPAVDRRTGRVTQGSGHWMSMLLEAVRQRGDVELAVATAYPRLPDLDFQEDGVRYLVAGQPRLRSQLGAHARDLERCAEFVRRVQPDIVHVHGTERFFGLLGARGIVSAPVVVSLQGLLSACLPVFFGSLRGRDIFAATRLVELLTRRGMVWDWLDFRRGARVEEEILRGTRYFLGRTGWDRSEAEARRPDARYHHVGELLRPEFSGPAWSPGASIPDRLMVTNVGNPRRGTETLLEAVATLARRRPGLRLACAGAVPERSGYGRWLRSRMTSLDLDGRVEWLGFLDARSLALQLGRARAYVTASVIENSANSLCEAMRLGLPCVASAAGGLPSLVQHGATGLLFEPGDAVGLAARLEQVLSDGALAARLGAAAREEATRRHDPAVVVTQLLHAYHEVIQHSRTAADPGPLRLGPAGEIHS